MPCRDGRDEYWPRENHDCSSRCGHGSQIRELRDKVDKYARWLCAILRAATVFKAGTNVSTVLINQASLPTGETVELNNWWMEHQRIDRERAIAEEKKAIKRKAIEAALSKLTTQEKVLLGIKQNPDVYMG